MELENKYAVDRFNKTTIFNFWNDQQNWQITGQIDQTNIEKISISNENEDYLWILLIWKWVTRRYHEHLHVNKFENNKIDQFLKKYNLP